jgi:hypothetical protein
MITETGYVALRGLLGCPESPDEEKARLSRSVRETEPISLVIASLRPPLNRRIIEAMPKEGGEPVRDLVRDNANFMPGMEGKWLGTRRFVTSSGRSYKTYSVY